MADPTIFVLTLNAARHPIAASQPFPPAETLPPSPPTLVFICIQELLPLAPSLLSTPASLAPYTRPLITSVLSSLSESYPHTPYTHHTSVNHGMTALFLFTRASTNLSGPVQTATVGVGVHDTSHKGAVALRLSAAGTEITLVSAHLAPHEWGAHARDADWSQIVQRLVFTSGAGDAQIYPTTRRGVMVFAGDLNYRTSDTRPDGRQKKWPAPDAAWEDFEALLDADQLSARRAQELTLHGLHEMPITFPCTYKVSAAGDEYVRERWPAWTDRILYTGPLGVDVYDSVRAFAGSDHRPVFIHAHIPSSEAVDVVTPPFGISDDWRERAQVARRKEVVLGTVLTTAGSAIVWGVVFAVLLVGVGAWWTWGGGSSGGFVAWWTWGGSSSGGFVGDW